MVVRWSLGSPHVSAVTLCDVRKDGAIYGYRLVVYRYGPFSVYLLPPDKHIACFLTSYAERMPQAVFALVRYGAPHCLPSERGWLKRWGLLRPE